MDKLYIEIICHAGEDQATAIISGSHTHFVYVERNGEVVLDKRGGTVGDEADDDIQLNFPMVYEFAKQQLRSMRFLSFSRPGTII